MAKESAWVQSFKEAALATAACAVVGSVLTNPQSTWYSGLRKPWFQPPGSAFPVVWTLLYGTTALGAAGTMAKLRDPGRQLGGPGQAGQRGQLHRCSAVRRVRSVVLVRDCAVRVSRRVEPEGLA